MCAINIVGIPKGIFKVCPPILYVKSKNSVRSEAPRTISGVVSGKTRKPAIAPEPFIFLRARAKAISEPRITAIREEPNAIYIDLYRELFNSG